jgi:hypothetical protein
VFELNRIRVVGIGPKGARYHDLLLDLSGGGQHISSAISSDMLDFGSEAPELRRSRGGAVTTQLRPSPATVLFLENGGGKSILLRLIYSVVLPGRLAIVGSKNTKLFEDYVLPGDTGHVVLEWVNVSTGEVLLTGKVYEWRRGGKGDLLETWWLAPLTATTDGRPRLSLDDLPLIDGRNRLRLSAFKDRCKEREPQFLSAAAPGEWSDHMSNRGLDPELFRYQRDMNGDEGEAAEAFTFNTDEAFVDKLLRIVTDPAQANLLAKNLTSYAGKLAERTMLVAENEFAEGAHSHLAKVAAAAGLAATRRGEVSTAQRGVSLAADQLRGCLRSDERTDAVLTLRHDAGRSRADLSDTARRVSNNVMLELRRRVAAFALEQAQQDLTANEVSRDQARETQQAWALTEKLVEHDGTKGRVRSLRELLERAQGEAEPFRRSRDAAASRLALAVVEAAAGATAAAERADGLEAQALAAAEVKEAVRDASAFELGGQSSRAELLATQADEAEAIVEAARREGVIPARTDPAIAEQRAAAEREDARGVQTVAEAGAATARLDLDSAREDAAAAKEQLADAEHTLESASNRLTEAEQARDALQRSPRLRALIGVDDVEFPAMLTAARQALEDATTASEVRLLELRRLIADNQRILDAVGTDGLLPPGREIQAALTVLTGAGIASFAGLTYLARTISTSEQRAALLRAEPALAAGIVVVDPAALSRAEQLLAAAALLPHSVIALGAAQRLVGASEEPYLVVDPNPAAYDEDAARLLREQVAVVLDEDRGSEQELRTRLAEDRGLTSELSRLVAARYPEAVPGSGGERVDGVALLAAEHSSAVALIGTAEETRRLAVAAVETAKNTLAAAEAAATAAAASALEAQNQHAAVRDTARAAALAAVSRDQETSARALAARAAQAREDAEGEALAARAAASAEHDAARDHRATAARLTDDLSRIIGASDVERRPGRPADAPLSELSQSYNTAQSSYQAQASDEALTAQLAEAERTESQCRAAVEAQPRDVISRARAVLESPGGADAAARAAELTRLSAELAHLETEEGRLNKLLGQRQTELTGASRDGRHPYTALEPPNVPTTLEQARSLAAAAETEHAAASALAQDWDTRVSQIEAARTPLARRLELIRELATSLDRENPAVQDDVAGAEQLTDEKEPSALLEGDEVLPRLDQDWTFVAGAGPSLSVEELRSVREVALDALRSARAGAEEAQRTFSESTKALREHAATYSHVPSPSREQMLRADEDVIAIHAAEWEEALLRRHRNLTAEIAEIETYRSLTVNRLAELTGKALKTLDRAQRLSRLPATLPGWEGQEFLRIQFAHPDAPTLKAYCADTLDRAATGIAQRTTKNEKPSIDGMTLLLRSVKAAFGPRGVAATVLKPDSTMRSERVRVTDMHEVLSGGQELTAAILLYCTLAALRANERGKAASTHNGVLFLDNPIGRASAGYLLDLQFSVAAALGVQLIYTTGLFDENALAPFPLLIRLRNDQDLAQGMKFTTVDKVLHYGIPDSTDRTPEEVEHGRLSAVRLLRRREQATPDVSAILDTIRPEPAP